MNNFGGSPDEKLHDATEFLKAGQKKEARRILREVLSTDRNNLAAWELLWRAAYNEREELICLNHILAIDPNHASAKRRHAMIRSTESGSQTSQTNSTIFNPSRTAPDTSPRRSASKRRGQATTLLILLGSFLLFMCISITGFALYRGGYLPFVFSSNLTATALAQNSASCQALIEKAMQRFSPFEMAKQAARKAAPQPATPAGRDEEIADLKARIDAMQEQLEGLARRDKN